MIVLKPADAGDGTRRITRPRSPTTLADRVTSQTDRLGRRIDYSYDNADQLVQEVWRDSGGTAVNTVVYSYDSNGKPADGGRPKRHDLDDL